MSEHTHVTAITTEGGIDLEFHEDVDTAYRHLVHNTIDADPDVSEHIDWLIENEKYDEIEDLLINRAAPIFTIQEIP